ncbi:hypothetical protein cypCar_00016107, partial [Cyprinus carpio]
AVVSVSVWCLQILAFIPFLLFIPRRDWTSGSRPVPEGHERVGGPRCSDGAPGPVKGTWAHATTRSAAPLKRRGFGLQQNTG